MQHEEFDPYRKWLGIAPKDQPPNHYRLLGVDLFESDPDVIAHAADQRMTHVRTFQTGPNASASQKILNELAAARGCLLDEQRRTQYDTELRAKQEPALERVPAAARPAAARPAAPRWRDEPVETAVEVESNGSPGPAIATARARGRGGRSSPGARHPKSRSSLPLFVGIGAVSLAVIGGLAFALARNAKQPEAAFQGGTLAPSVKAAPGPPAQTVPAPPQPQPPVVPVPPKVIAPPKIFPVMNQTVRAGEPLDLQLRPESTPEPGRRIQFGVVRGPAGATIDESGRFHFRPARELPPQSAEIVLRAAWLEDPSRSAEVSFNVQVLPSQETAAPRPVIPVPRPWKKLAPPAAADVASQMAQVRGQFAAELAGANREAWRTVVGQLRREAFQTSDLPRKYALLAYARDLAARERDLPNAWQSIDILAGTFELDGIAMKAEVLRQVTDPAGGAATARYTAQMYLNLLQYAKATYKFVAGKPLIEAARAAGRLSGDSALQARIEASAVDLLELAGEEERAERARNVLETDPNNAQANYVWGRYLYLLRFELSAGLPLLARGDNQNYKRVAAAELATPTDALGRKQIGDLWWEIQKSEPPAVRPKAMMRVLYWYNQARNGLDEAGRAEINGRTTEIQAAQAALAPVLPAPAIPPGADKPSPENPVPAKPVAVTPVPDKPVEKPGPEKPSPEKPNPEKPGPDKPVAKPTPKPPSQPELKPLTNDVLANLVRTVVQRGGRVRLKEKESWIYKEEDLPPGNEWTVLGLGTEKDVADDTLLRLVGRIPTLQELTLESKWITDAAIHRLSGLTQLTRIELASPRMTDSSVSALAGMTALGSLTLRGGEQFGGAKLELLTHLSKLTNLELSGGKISDGTLADIEKLEQLTSLSLRDGHFTTRGIGRLQSLENLTGLTLKANSINDQAVTHVAKLTKLKRLTLEGPMRGSTLGALADLEQLESLSITSMAVEERDVATLAKVTSLRHLTLKTRPLSNGVLEKLAPLTELRTLNIQTNGGFNEAGLKHLDAWPKLESAYLAGLRISMERYEEYRKNHPNVSLAPKPEWGDKLKEWGEKHFGPRRNR